MRRGLFYGVWLGGVFGLFRNHVASLREQAKIAEEDERLAQVRVGGGGVGISLNGEEFDGSGEVFPLLCECRACIQCACCDMQHDTLYT